MRDDSKIDGELVAAGEEFLGSVKRIDNGHTGENPARRFRDTFFRYHR